MESVVSTSAPPIALSIVDSVNDDCPPTVPEAVKLFAPFGLTPLHTRYEINTVLLYAGLVPKTLSPNPTL